MNPIIALLFNVARTTYHPIVFLESPLPGPYSPDKPVRHKSKMHHTGGFATREEAVANATNDLASRVKQVFGEPRLALGRDIQWDGEGIPAMVAMFVQTPEGLVDAFEAVAVGA